MAEELPLWLAPWLGPPTRQLWLQPADPLPYFAPVFTSVMHFQCGSNSDMTPFYQSHDTGFVRVADTDNKAEVLKLLSVATHLDKYTFTKAIFSASHI